VKLETLEHLNDDDLASGKGRPKANGKAPAYHGGHTYQHPSDKTKVWNARGQKPGWVRALEAEGKRAVEVAAEAPRGTSSTAEKK
jgi:DNA-binding protein H-NS